MGFVTYIRGNGIVQGFVNRVRDREFFRCKKMSVPTHVNKTLPGSITSALALPKASVRTPCASFWFMDTVTVSVFPTG